MIFYLSNSLGNSKQGGSSLSGLHFLNLLKDFYGETPIIISDSAHNSIRSLFHYRFIPTENYLVKYDAISVAKYLIKLLFNFGFCKKRYTFNCKDDDVIVYINSFSNILSHVQFENYKTIKMVCVVRGDVDSFTSNKDDYYNLAWATSFLNSMDCLIYVSKGIKQNWQSLVKKESHYLPNSIAEKTVDAKAMNPYDKGDFNIAVVGSVQKRKGQMKLRSIIQKLNNPRIKFHVIGGLASNNEADEILESLNTISSVVYHGHKNNIENYLHFANLAILLSDSEAFPRTVAEYIYYGKAVVSTDVSGATEMVIDGYNGFIVENSSDNFSQIFADKIDLFFTDTDTLDLFSSRSRAIYDDNFSSNLQKASLEKILQNV